MGGSPVHARTWTGDLRVGLQKGSCMKLSYYTLILFTILCSACVSPGYSVKLKTDNTDQAITQIRQVLLSNGFEKENSPVTGEIVDRYRKKLLNVKRIFSNRNAEYWIQVDIRQKQQDGNIEVEIYNVYVGNSPEVRPVLNETADSIENALKKAVPNISIRRTGNVIAVPII